MCLLFSRSEASQRIKPQSSVGFTVRVRVRFRVCFRVRVCSWYFAVQKPLKRYGICGLGLELGLVLGFYLGLFLGLAFGVG